MQITRLNLAEIITLVWNEHIALIKIHPQVLTIPLFALFISTFSKNVWHAHVSMDGFGISALNCDLNVVEPETEMQ